MERHAKDGREGRIRAYTKDTGHPMASALEERMNPFYLP